MAAHAEHVCCAWPLAAWSWQLMLPRILLAEARSSLLSGRMVHACIRYISCLYDSTGESTDNNWENSENVKFE